MGKKWDIPYMGEGGGGDFVPPQSPHPSNLILLRGAVKQLPGLFSEPGDRRGERKKRDRGREWKRKNMVGGRKRKT